MKRNLHETVDAYFAAIAPLVDEPHQRLDDRGARLMGRIWLERGVSHLIGVEAFKATGDAPRFHELWVQCFGKGRKPRPEYEVPEVEVQAATSEQTLH